MPPSLREWQSAGMAAWEQAGFRGTFEVATGGGKTTFALACYLRFRESNPEARCLVVVPTVALLDQWFVAAQEEIGLEEDSIKVLSARDLRPDAQMNLVVINSARGLRDAIEQADARSLMQVVDECHRAGSPENARSLLAVSAASMGLSATPFRDFDEGFEEYVAPALGPVIFRYTLSDAIADGVLAGLRLTYVKVPLLPDEERDYRALSGRIARAFQGGASEETIESLLRKRARLYNNAAYRLPTMAKLMAEHRGRRALVFVESIDAAKQAHQMLDQSGHSVTTYHSRMGPHLRRSNLRAFRRGVFDVLIACRALDEGFNVPEAEIALIVAGTSARRQRIQRVGRVLRAIAGKDSADVITLYATPVEEERLAKEAEEFPDDLIRWVEARVGR